MEVPDKKKFEQEKRPSIGANGFILPRKESFESPYPSRVKVTRNSPTSFSVNGIAASSPEKPKVMSQERALNEGRDFLDILEACRPRNSGAMPSALQAILKMYRKPEKVDHSEPDSPDPESEEGGTDDTLKPLREWTSMDFDIDEPYKVMRPRSGSYAGLYDRNSSDRSDSSALSSPSSSYASLVGVSYDRHLLGRHKGTGAPLGRIQLQRSPSLQYETQQVARDDESVKSNTSWSTMGVEGESETATDDEVGSFNKASRRERDRYEDHLRTLMATHDANYFNEPSLPLPTAEIQPGRPQAFPLNESYGSLSPVGGMIVPQPPIR